MTEELFFKKLPVVIKIQDHDDRRTHIQVAVELNRLCSPITRKELVMRLTDENDLLFLYNLSLSEEDFQTLKVQQGLLVDFSAFPQKFIDLLELCIQEEHKEVPKFVLHLACNGPSLASTASLNVTETNAFKHLQHLSLKFIPGSDSDVKRHLTECLKTLKSRNAELLQRYEHSEAELSQQLRQTREALSTRTQEITTIKSEWTSRINEINNRHSQELNAERERTLQAQTGQQQKFDRERRELEQAHVKIVKQMETRTYDLELANKELTDLKYKSESTTRDLRSKLTLTEDENQHIKTELQTLRKENVSLSTDKHEQEKAINQLKMRLAVLEQEVKDKEEVMRKTNDLYGTEQGVKKHFEVELDQKKRHIMKLEAQIKTIYQEVTKANEILQNKIAEIKGLRTELKKVKYIASKQEKTVVEKQKELEDLRRELDGVRANLRLKEDECKKLSDSFEATLRKLEESRQILKTNEDVISWLSKQATQNELQQRHGTFELSSRGPTPTMFRPSAGLMYGNSIPQYGINTAPQYGISTASRTPPSMTFDPSPITSVPGRLSLVQYQSVPASRTSVMSAPLSKSSPIASQVPTEQRTTPTSRDGLLDAKYLQQSEDQPVRSGPAAGVTSPTSIHFPPAASLPSVRLSKDFILTAPPAVPTSQNLNVLTSRDTAGISRDPRDSVTPRTSNDGQKITQPPLASAYFPSKIS